MCKTLNKLAIWSSRHFPVYGLNILKVSCTSGDHLMAVRMKALGQKMNQYAIRHAKCGKGYEGFFNSIVGFLRFVVEHLTNFVKLFMVLARVKWLKSIR